jgi:hypothetical protein
MCAWLCLGVLFGFGARGDAVVENWKIYASLSQTEKNNFFSRTMARWKKYERGEKRPPRCMTCPRIEQG